MASSDDLCSLVMFLSRFSIASWDSKDDALASQFFYASQDSLNKTLQQEFGKQIRINGKNVLIATWPENNCCSKLEILQIMEEAICKMESQGLDFTQQAQDIVASLKQYLAEHCTYLPDLSKIDAAQMLATGGDLTPYEVGFMGSGNYVMYPDVNAWSSEHLEYLQKSSVLTHLLPEITNLRAKWLLFYRLTFYPSIVHEFVHCIQTAVKQTDKISWSAEHDASRLALILLRAMVQDSKYPIAKYFAQPGRMEAVVLHLADRIRLSNSNVKPEEVNKYREWVNAFGLKPPTPDAFSSHNESRFVTSFYKYRITLEAHCNTLVQNNDCHAQSMMQVCFANRTGDVYQVPLQVPEQLHINDKAIKLIDSWWL